jgi:hypothetical protein
MEAPVPSEGVQFEKRPAQPTPVHELFKKGTIAMAKDTIHDINSTADDAADKYKPRSRSSGAR